MTSRLRFFRNEKEKILRFSLKSVFLCLILITNIHLSGLTQEAAEIKPDPYVEAITSFSHYAAQQMKTDYIPGLSIGFMKDGFFWARGFGYSDLENRVLTTSESSYRLASITKTFTAIAVLQLVEAGKINLDAEVQTYVPYFPRKKWPVTIRMLLGHLSGIRHYSSYEEEHIKVHKNTKEAIEVFQDFDLVAEPGTKYSYSTYGYNLLGAVIEAASGQSYGDYIQENIFKPLGMAHSLLESPKDLIPHRVRGYRVSNGRIQNSEYVDISSRFAGGGTRSTVIDLLKYAKGICDGELLKSETWKAMFTSMSTRDGYLIKYGMGWRVSPWRGHYQVSHSGSQPETITFLMIFPTERFAIAACANLERAKLMPYVRRLAELVLDQDLDSSTYLPSRQEQELYNACLETFSYGLSHHDFFGDSQRLNPKDLHLAFEFFNKNVNTGAINNDPSGVTKKLQDGIHPAAQNAFIRVGAYIARILEQTYGKDRLRDYPQNPLRFFSDYARMKDPDYGLSRNITQQIARWEEDWARTYPDTVRYLHISVETDFDNLLPQLKETFGNAVIYPDFSEELRDVAGIFIARNDIARSLQILKAGVELYPDNPINLLALGNVYVLAGDATRALNLYKKSHTLTPIDPRYFDQLAEKLAGLNQIEGLSALNNILAELYPRNPNAHEKIADIYLKLGNTDAAIKHYQRALKLDPNLTEAKTKLQELLKK